VAYFIILAYFILFLFYFQLFYFQPIFQPGYFNGLFLVLFSATILFWPILFFIFSYFFLFWLFIFSSAVAGLFYFSYFLQLAIFWLFSAWLFYFILAISNTNFIWPVTIFLLALAGDGIGDAVGEAIEIFRPEQARWPVADNDMIRHERRIHPAMGISEAASINEPCWRGQWRFLPPALSEMC
jgi:hypothetical protein